MPEQKPIKFTELFHFSEPTNAKIKLNRNNTTFPAWDLLLHDDPEWEIMNAYRGGERNNNHKMNGREYLFAFAHLITVICIRKMPADISQCRCSKKRIHDRM